MLLDLFTGLGALTLACVLFGLSLPPIVKLLQWWANLWGF